jgi:L,D-peptidoglycan transpeptidase YkuD (ErfK/YbiS/YcfS/YnhG family)
MPRTSSCWLTGTRGLRTRIGRQGLPPVSQQEDVRGILLAFPQPVHILVHTSKRGFQPYPTSSCWLTGTRGLRTRIGRQGLPSAFINSGT